MELAKKVQGGLRRKTILFLRIIAVLVLAVFLYHRTLTAYFVGEDYEWWTRVRELGWIDSLRLFLPPDFGGVVLPPYWRPLVGWTVWLNTVPLGMTPVVFHATSLAFHLINIVLVGILGFYLFKKDLTTAFLASTLFATFPFHTEAVVWSVGGRYDVVMAAFYLLSLLAVIRYTQTENRAWVTVAFLAFFLGLLSKESAVTLPLVAFCLLVVSCSQSAAKILRQYRHLFLGLLLAFLFYFFLRSLALKTVDPYALTRHIEFFGLSRVFGLYLGIFLGMALLRLFMGKIIPKIFLEREKTLWLLFLFIGVMFLPTANLPTQERQLYLPSTAAVLYISGLAKTALVWTQKKSEALKKAFLFLLLFTIFFNGTLLFQRNENWRTAGEIAQQIASQLAKELKELSGEDKVYLINIPDSLNGVYVYRTHLREAAEFRTGREIPELVLTPTTIGINSQVLVVGQKSLLVESDEGFILFRPSLDEQGRLTKETFDYRVTQLNKKTLRVDFFADEFDTQKSLIYTFVDSKIKRL